MLTPQDPSLLESVEVERTWGVEVRWAALLEMRWGKAGGKNHLLAWAQMSPPKQARKLPREPGGQPLPLQANSPN